MPCSTSARRRPGSCCSPAWGKLVCIREEGVGRAPSAGTVSRHIWQLCPDVKPWLPRRTVLNHKEDICTCLPQHEHQTDRTKCPSGNTVSKPSRLPPSNLRPRVDNALVGRPGSGRLRAAITSELQ